MVTVDQQDQRDHGAKNRQIDDRVPINRKTLIVHSERVQKPLPPTQHGKQMHDRHGTISEGAEDPDQRQPKHQQLRGRDPVNLQQAQVDVVEMPGQLLVLTRCNHLVDCPEEQKPDQPQTENE